MLRASIDTIEGGELICPTITSGLGNCGVAKGDVIRAFADSVALRDDDEYPDCRVRAEFALGRDGADRIAMVTGNFSMMNRALDAIGAPIDSAMDSLAAEMGTSIPAHLRRTRSTTVRAKQTDAS